MTRTADRLTDTETTLKALVEAVNANADQHAQRQTEILTAVGKLGDNVAGLVEAIQTVMAARAEHDAGVAAHAKRAAEAAESAFVGVQTLAAKATEVPGPAELAAAVREHTEAVRQVHHAVVVPQELPDPGPSPAGGPGTAGKPGPKGRA